MGITLSVHSQQSKEKAKKAKKFYQLDLQLLVRIVLFSTAIAILMTCLQLYLLFDANRKKLDKQFDSIKSSHVPSLTDQVWNVDGQAVALTLNGKSQPSCQERT